MTSSSSMSSFHSFPEVDEVPPPPSEDDNSSILSTDSCYSGSAPSSPGSSGSEQFFASTRMTTKFIERARLPTKEVLYWTRKQLRSAQHPNSTFQERLKAARKYKNGKMLEQYLSTLNPVTRRFIDTKTRDSASSRYSFSAKDKVAALRLYRSSPDCYGYLADLFGLPSTRSLKGELAKIRLKPGINAALFQSLKKRASTMHPKDKYCAVTFHHMFLTPRLDYNARMGHIDGFEDFGNGSRRKRIADHALVFMIRGIWTGYKQAVYYSFSRGKAAWQDVKDILLTVISKLQECGLCPVAVVCDHFSDNKRMMRSLKNDTMAPSQHNDEVFFLVNGFAIFPIFDPPHLLKSVRNRLMATDVEFFMHGVKRTASWDNVQQLYDCTNDPKLFYSIINLNVNNIAPGELIKMKYRKKVYIAAKFFSIKLAAMLNILCTSSGRLLTKDPVGTVQFIQLFDELFDSVNGDIIKHKKRKEFRCAVGVDSPHSDFWNACIEILKTFKFVDRRTGADLSKRVALADSWIVTLRNMYNIWTYLSEFQYLKTRNLNLDALENFFGCVRSHGRSGIANPTCAQFATAYKSTMISGHSLYPRAQASNCENTHSPALLTDMADFGYAPYADRPETHNYGGNALPVSMAGLNMSGKLYSSALRSVERYISGCLFKKMRRHFRKCYVCLESCLRDPDYTTSRHDCRYFYPSEDFVRNVVEIKQVTELVLGSRAHSLRLLRLANDTILNNIDFAWVMCDDHVGAMRELIVGHTVPHFIQEWCQNVSGKVCGKDRRPYRGEDAVKQMAVKQFSEYSKYNKRILINSISKSGYKKRSVRMPLY